MAFDEAAELRPHMRIAQNFGSGANAVIALQFLTADIQQTDTGRGEAKRHARKSIPHDGKFHQVARIALHIGAKIQQHNITARGRPNGRQRGTINFRHGLDDNLGKRHQRPGIASGNNTRRFAGSHSINRNPHGRTTHAQGCCRLQITRNNFRRMAQAAYLGGTLAQRQRPTHARLIPHQQEAGTGMTLSGQFQTIEHNLRCRIPAHGINRQGESGPCISHFGSLGALGCAGSEPDGRLQAIRCHHFAAIIIAAMGADMMRALQFAAIGAFMMRRACKRMMAATHAAAGRRSLLFRNGHGAGSLSLKRNCGFEQGRASSTTFTAAQAWGAGSALGTAQRCQLGEGVARRFLRRFFKLCRQMRPGHAGIGVEGER